MEDAAASLAAAPTACRRNSRTGDARGAGPTYAPSFSTFSAIAVGTSRYSKSSIA